MPQDDECPVCHQMSPMQPAAPQIKIGDPLICPKCASVITRDENGLREPLIKEMLLWDQKTHNIVSLAQECIRKGAQPL